MPTVFSHAMTGAAVVTLFGLPARPGAWLAGVACAMLPDADVIGLWFGVPWGHVLGHRGITHSLPFAAALAAVVVALIFRGAPWRGRRLRLWAVLFVATASHGLLDAMTDGGSGIAFFAPLDDTRYFLPWRPIRVSPIGLERFLSQRGVEVLRSELVWVWLPAIGLVTITALVRRGR
jgi:inner membrane protein